MGDKAPTTLESELAALEAAIPFLRRSMAPEQFDAQIRDCCKDIIDSARTQAEVAYARERLNSIPVPAGSAVP
jgi:hypothetical protein